MHLDCPTFKLLWMELSDATKSHLAILAKFQLAQIEHNNASLTGLKSLMLAAGQGRDKARIAFRDHEATHQDEGAKSQTA
jgi:hypothetical protein